MVRPEPNRYFPPVELRDDEFLSGYVVPALAASASGRICVAGRCSEVTDAPAYHDHNWGVWRDVTWEWGSARGERLSLLYGGVYGPERSTTSPFFLTLVDSLGVRRVLRFGRIDYEGSRAADGVPGARAPERFTLTGTWEADTVTLSVDGGARARHRDAGGVVPPALPADAGSVRAGAAGFMGEPVQRPGPGVLRDLSDAVNSMTP